MSDDYKVSPLSDQQIEETADSMKKYFGISMDEAPNIVELLNRSELRTRYGIKKLSLKLVPNGYLQGDEARTLATSERIEIQIEVPVFEKAKSGDGRARMTLAHELGHAVLHEKPVPLARPMLETTRPAYIPPYESAEHQAKYFASAFLIPRQIVPRFSTAEALASACHVSLQAATIRMEQCAPKLKRTIPPATQKIIDELKATASRSSCPRVVDGPIRYDALQLWDKAASIPGEDPTEYRKSPSGFRIKKTEFKKVNAQRWFIENGQIHAAIERHDC